MRGGTITAKRVINITYRFAKYKYEFLSGLGYAQKAEVFKLMMQELCDHEFKQVSDDDDIQICEKCGLCNYDCGDNIFQCDCSNCKWLDIEGGDIVPYGSTTATTPSYEICEADIPEDDQREDYYGWIMHNPDCPHWEGRYPKKGMIFNGI